jgi:lysophospholipase L1-like esterase
MQNQSAAHDTRKSAQVLPFRRPGYPPPLAQAPANPIATQFAPPPRTQSTNDDFARYEAEREEPLNERQRMLMNLIGIAIVVVLISTGVWIADTIQVSVKAQDCALQGRTNCAPIEVLSQR